MHYGASWSSYRPLRSCEPFSGGTRLQCSHEEHRTSPVYRLPPCGRRWPKGNARDLQSKHRASARLTT